MLVEPHLEVLVPAFLLGQYRSCVAISIHCRPVFFDVLEELSNNKCVIRRAAVEITLPPIQGVPSTSHLGHHLPPLGLSISPPNVSVYGPFRALSRGFQTLNHDSPLCYLLTPWWRNLVPRFVLENNVLGDNLLENLCNCCFNFSLDRKTPCCSPFWSWKLCRTP